MEGGTDGFKRVVFLQRELNSCLTFTTPLYQEPNCLFCKIQDKGGIINQ